MDVVTEADEGRHPTGPEPGWVEVHRVDAWHPDASLAISWSAIARPAQGRAAFLAAVLGARDRPIVLSEHDITLPARGWELRASGLWADHVCETPLDHWSYGLEAFALLVDDPRELVGRGVGDRVPLGWELEFEAAAPPDVEGPAAYRQRGEVHGILLVGSDQLEVELEAVRRHWWGAVVPSPLSAGAAPAAGAVALPGPSGCWWVELTADGLRVVHEAW